MSGLVTYDPGKAQGQSNEIRRARSSTSLEASRPHSEAFREAYGRIFKVDGDSNVSVRLFKDRSGYDLEDDPISEGEFLPLINSLTEIHLLYGELRPNLVCRITWTGEHTPDISLSPILVQIVSDIGERFGSKKPKENVLNIGAYRFLSGGSVSI